MKKNFIIGMSMLVASVAFVSCSKTDVFEENKKYAAEQEKSEYRTNFVKMYGEVSPNQSWDFCVTPNYETSTRAAGSLTWGYLDPINEWLTRWASNDKAKVIAAINGAEVKEFNPYVAVDLYPAYSYVASDNNKTDFYRLAVCYNNNTENIFRQGIGYFFEVLNKGWNTLGRFGRTINSKSLTGASNVYWALYPTDINVWGNESVIGGTIADYKIDTYKEFTVNGRTYWAFRVGPNGSYSDLICMVKNIDPNRPIEKRYMIEDLGSKKDFDFNDIVVDVYQAIDGSQKAIIRAMGGTIDFTLKIGNTEWTKSVDGVKAGYQVETMYNTENPQWDDNLAEFPVSGWDPSTNNITVSVNSVANEGVIISFPFSRTGEVPMIIAVDTHVDWQLEKVSLPQNWWTPATETEE